MQKGGGPRLLAYFFLGTAAAARIRELGRGGRWFLDALGSPETKGCDKTARGWYNSSSSSGGGGGGSKPGMAATGA